MSVGGAARGIIMNNLYIAHLAARNCLKSINMNRRKGEIMTENPLVVAPQTDHMLAVKDVKGQVTALHKLFRDVMKEGDHYGVIPGTKKPTLYKAGAEKICLLLRLSPHFKRNFSPDGDHLTVFSECVLIHAPTEMVVSEAGSICTTKETKYAYREATRKCPECGKPAIIKGKAEFGGGWLCFKKRDGCGAKFKDDDPKIAMQSGEREDNPNLYDAHNTVLKMADKRAYVGATLFGTAASDIFTQDVEDFGNIDPNPPPVVEEACLEGQEVEDIELSMEHAHESGQLAEYWVEIKDRVRMANPVQRKRLIAFKDELKASRPEQAAGEDSPANEIAPTQSQEATDPAASTKKRQSKKKAETPGADNVPPASATTETPPSPQERYPEMSPAGAQLMTELEASKDTLGSWWDANTERFKALPPPDQRAIREASDAIENRDQVE